MDREPNTEYVLSLSYGKDSLACLGAIEQLGWPLDRIIHAEVWATDTIPADLPPMVEFKKKADEIILERYGIEVEHVCATRGGAKDSFVRKFYETPCRGKYANRMRGFPYTSKSRSWCRHLKIDIQETHLRRSVLQDTQASQGGGVGNDTDSPCSEEIGVHPPSSEKSSTRISGFPGIAKLHRAQWCTGDLKKSPLRISNLRQSRQLVYKTQTDPFSNQRDERRAKINIVQYLGIAADEPERIKRHLKPGYALPLVEIGWDEAHCRRWCEERDLLSPIYTTSTRGGCWFCHNQGVDQLRILRRNYPDLWKLLLKWDTDSPVTFHADGHTVHDFDARFALEDAGLVFANERWKWSYLKEPPPKQTNLEEWSNEE